MSRINKKLWQVYSIGNYYILIDFTGGLGHNVSLIEEPLRYPLYSPSHKYNYNTIINTIAYLKLQFNKVNYFFIKNKTITREQYSITESDFFKKLREIDECQKPSARLKNNRI